MPHSFTSFLWNIINLLLQYPCFPSINLTIQFLHSSLTPICSSLSLLNTPKLRDLYNQPLRNYHIPINTSFAIKRTYTLSSLRMLTFKISLSITERYPCGNAWLSWSFMYLEYLQIGGTDSNIRDFQNNP